MIFSASILVLAVTIAFVPGNAGARVYNTDTPVIVVREDIEITADTSDYLHYGAANQYSSRNQSIYRTYPKTRWKDDKWEHFEPGIGTISYIRRKRSLISNILFGQRFSAKIIAPGEDISLQCTASADRPPRFIWERDGVIISSNTDSRYAIGQLMSLSGHGASAQFNISRARVEDGGRYSCAAIEGDASAVHSARIDVYGPPYIRTLPPIKVQSGEALKLRCPYYGYPISKLEWENKGKKLLTTTLPHISRYKRSYGNNIKSKRRKNDAVWIQNENTRRNNVTDGRFVRKRRQIFEHNEEGVLNIPKLEKEDNGESYTCIVYSPSGEMARRAFEIQVVEAPLLDELRVGTGLKEGQIVQITCNIISGDPPIYFSWLKDGKKIPPNLKITERGSELFSVLIIKRVSLEHCGQYTCIATNHVGKVNQTADLYINVAPKWIVEPTNTSLLLGQRGAVHCNANGFPAPQIHWVKKDANLGIWRPVLDLAGGGVMSYPNGTLIIEVVSLADEGLYTCNVENGVGEALNKNLWINVNKPIHFESMGMNLTTKKGLPISLTCKPLGDSPIRIKWALDGRSLDFTTSRLTISETSLHNGLKNTLSISYTESKDAGTYECRASNPFGVASYNIFLEVLEPPSRPADVQLSSVSSSSARVRWRHTPAQYYTLQYSAPHHPPTLLNVTRQDDMIQTAELRELKPATDYIVKIASGNQVDLSPYTEPLHFTTHQEAPSAPPLAVQVAATEVPGELVAAWLPPAADAQHGPLQGYHVRAVPALTDQQDAHAKTVKVLARKNKQETTLSGLLKNTRYAVTISAFNSAGNGPFSLPVYQTTREGAPELAPSNVECRGVSSTSIRASWRALNVLGASLLGYYVYYATEDGPWQNITSPQTETYLQTLQKYTNYSVKVAGFSSYGIGPFSYPIVCITLQDVPGPPAAIKVLMSSATSILVSWKRPERPNGEITHYTVHVKLMSSSNSPQLFRVESTPAPQLTFPVTGLTGGRQYEVYVKAHTNVGEGTASSREHIDLGTRGTYFDENKVVAGVSSLGGRVAAGAGSSLLLVCQCVGVPPPRTVWYHQHNIITHHPRFTRNHDDSLLINNIDQSLSGNYTCLAKNMFGSDSVSYDVSVLPTPDPPVIRVTANKNSLHLQWDEPRRVAGKMQKIGKPVYYQVNSLSWKEANGVWQDAFTNQGTSMRGVQEYTLEDLKCGTKYSIRMIAANSVGSSQPTYVEASTLGGVPIAPTTTEWFWSNASQISLQVGGWDDGGCGVRAWSVDYRARGGSWRRAHIPQDIYSYSSSSLSASTITLSGLSPATWYQIRVLAQNSAGAVTSVYNYATTTITGESIGPPSDTLDINVVVIVCSSILLFVCSVTCVYILVKRHQLVSSLTSTVEQHGAVSLRGRRLSSFRGSVSECKSVRSTAATTPAAPDRVYSTPVHLHNQPKHAELYEISPYAQFALGFRTFGHVENNEAPRHHSHDSETSFQMRSESEESDCMSRTTTLKSAPRKVCRIPHHR